MVIRNPSRFKHLVQTTSLAHLIGYLLRELAAAQTKILTEPAVTEEQMVLL